MEVTIVWNTKRPDEVERLLRDLPEWFGIEHSMLSYVDAARTLPSTFAVRGSEVVGVCVVRHHTAVAAEIEVLAVARTLHREGIGRRLVQAVESGLRESGVALLQVKTLGPSGASEEYERTRAFYASIGFLPLEERTDIWGAKNPCLISGVSDHRPGRSALLDSDEADRLVEAARWIGFAHAETQSPVSLANTGVDEVDEEPATNPLVPTGRDDCDRQFGYIVSDETKAMARLGERPIPSRA